MASVLLADATAVRSNTRGFVPTDWKVRYFEFGAAPDTPTKADAFATLTSAPPIRTERTDRLDYLSSSSPWPFRAAHDFG